MNMDRFLIFLLNGNWDILLTKTALTEISNWLNKQQDSIVAFSMKVFNPERELFRVILLCNPQLKNGSITVNNLLIGDKGVDQRLWYPHEFELRREHFKPDIKMRTALQ